MWPAANYGRSGLHYDFCRQLFTGMSIWAQHDKQGTNKGSEFLYR